MTRRSTDWNIGLSKDLKSPHFAREFILAAQAEGLPLQLALAKVIRAYGVKEFASKVKLPSSNLLRAVNPKSNPTLETLRILLEPFGLEVSVAPAKKKRAA